MNNEKKINTDNNKSIPTELVLASIFGNSEFKHSPRLIPLKENPEYCKIDMNNIINLINYIEQSLMTLAFANPELQHYNMNIPNGKDVIRAVIANDERLNSTLIYADNYIIYTGKDINPSAFIDSKNETLNWLTLKIKSCIDALIIENSYGDISKGGFTR